jgi:hypothetical protein
MFDLVAADVEMTGWLGRADPGELRALWESWADEQEPDVSAEIEGLGPGLMLAATLDSVDFESLSGRDRVSVMIAFQRMASHYQAMLYASIASVAEAVSETLAEDAEGDLALIEDACAAEIRTALRLTRRAADSELAVARGFRERLPEVWQALSEGLIDRRRANLIVHRTDHLSIAQAREVARRALEKAPDLTTGQLTALLGKLGVEVDPDDAKHRYEEAVNARRVVLESGADGTAHLHLMDLPPDRATRIRAGIAAAARELRRKGDARTMDQLHADIFMDLLDPAPSHASSKPRTGAIVMTVDLATLAGLTESSGDLGGYGPVIADIARQVADESPHAEWRFVVTGPGGRPLGGGATRRRPTAAQRRTVQALYPTCTFPGCRMPAMQSDLDHTTPHADGGPTRVDNLAPLCRHDHMVRHGAGWSYRPTTDGDHEWTSPLGHRYRAAAQAP